MAVSKAYGVDDTVWVWYKNSATFYFTPQSRKVASVDVQQSTNEATVRFTNGDSIQDGTGAAQTVFTTQALCAKQIVDQVIVNIDAAVALDTTPSAVSTAGATALSLARSSVN